MDPTVPLPLFRVSVASIKTSLPDVQLGISMISYRQLLLMSLKGTVMAHKGELQTLTKLSIRHQICPSETCVVQSYQSTITMLMFRGRSDCGVTHYVSIYD